MPKLHYRVIISHPSGRIKTVQWHVDHIDEIAAYYIDTEWLPTSIMLQPPAYQVRGSPMTARVAKPRERAWDIIADFPTNQWFTVLAAKTAIYNDNPSLLALDDWHRVRHHAKASGQMATSFGYWLWLLPDTTPPPLPTLAERPLTPTCQAGHKRTVANTSIVTKSNGRQYRRCKFCAAAAAARQYALTCARQRKSPKPDSGLGRGKPAIARPGPVLSCRPTFDPPDFDKEC